MDLVCVFYKGLRNQNFLSYLANRKQTDGKRILPGRGNLRLNMDQFNKKLYYIYKNNLHRAFRWVQDESTFP